MRLLLVIGGGSTALEIRECADLFYKDLFEKVYNVIGDNENQHFLILFMIVKSIPSLLIIMKWLSLSVLLIKNLENCLMRSFMLVNLFPLFIQRLSFHPQLLLAKVRMLEQLQLSLPIHE